MDCFHRPISSPADAWIDVVEYVYSSSKDHAYDSSYNRMSCHVVSCRRTTRVSRCLNLGSFNYLGFAASDEYCTPRVIEDLKKFSPSTCSTQIMHNNIA
ncbi:serine palmitoyltransferase component [Orobanche minor]